MIFTFEKDKEITGDVLLNFIRLHEQDERPQMEKLKGMYLGQYEILDMPPKDLGKPDNRIVVNFAKYIVDTFNGYFIGIPLKITHDADIVNAAVDDFRNRCDMEDNEAELAKICSIFGKGYEYLYQNEEGKTAIAYNEPLDIFIIYDDTVQQKRIAGVRYWYTEDGQLKGELRTAEADHDFHLNSDKTITIEDGTPHYYGNVPIVEYIENEERQSIFHHVISLMNGLNKALSEKANDIEYFSDAYLAIMGSEVTAEEAGKLKDNRLLNIYGTGSENVKAFFLEKPNSDATQENFINRAIELIYQTAMVANINNESFGNSSGVALEFKLQAMKNLAALKQRKFQSAMQQRYRMIFALPTNVPSSQASEWANLKYQFTLNMPRNLRDEVETAVKMTAITSEETALSTISTVDNAKRERERRQDEMNAGYSAEPAMLAAIATVEALGGTQQAQEG